MARERGWQWLVAQMASVMRGVLPILGFAVAAPSVAETVPARKPDIVLIVSDDQGYADVGLNGSTDIPTPNIDRIAREGVRFTRGYVTFPVCGPSRAGLLTGRYQSRFGFDRNPNADPTDPRGGMPLTEEILPEMLQRAGYHSMLVGKWHMGTHPSLRPRKRGFDEFYGMLEGGHSYRPEETQFENIYETRKLYDWYRAKLTQNETSVHFQKYLTDEFSDRAVDFIRRRADQPEPYFLYLAYNAPHTPLQASDPYLARFSHIRDEKRRTYAAMISAMDDGVGKVLAEIDRTGRARDTIVIFLTDNGGVTPGKAGDQPVASNRPLRGGKRDLYEGGIRVPFAIRWPARIPGGRDHDQPVSSMDIVGTLAGQLGIALRPDRPLDGVDLVPYLRGEKSGPPHPMLFFRDFDRGASAIVAGDRKYVSDGKVAALFDLRADPGETTDIAPANADEVARYKTVFDAWNANMAREPAFPPLGTWPPPAGGSTGPEGAPKAGQPGTGAGLP